jgi:prepilin-type N-terminal cleavage/methylation domain-containing protein
MRITRVQFRLAGNRRGMTLVEVMVGMTIFAIGLLGLSKVTFHVMRANLRSRHTAVATNLAHERMEQVMSVTRYSAITEANFPDEGFGAVNGGMLEYNRFSRTVSIADSVNALGNSVLKEITVRVDWRESTGMRNVELRSSISRFKDITL